MTQENRPTLPPLPSAGLGLVVRGNRQMPAFAEKQLVQYGRTCYEEGHKAALLEAAEVCASHAGVRAGELGAVLRRMAGKK